MRRILEYRITEEENLLPIKNYLKRKGYSTQNLIELKKEPGNVTVNGIPAYLNRRLQTDDILTVHIKEKISSEKIEPVKLPFDIVYEDEDLLVVNKPAGMPIHPSLKNHGNTLANALAWYYAQQNKPFVFRCVNRLDRDTSGLTIIAKHMVSAGILNSYVCEKVIVREYLAIVRGSITPQEGTITAPLSRKEGSILERMVDYERGESAITHYRLVEEKNGHSLISLRLETGRTHQIRIHMKHIGFPLIGDYLYNPDTDAISRQALHSCRLSFPHPVTGAPLEFTAPLPKDMRRVLEPATDNS